MANREASSNAVKKDRLSLLEMTATEARSFLLEPSSYSNITLPPYFDFGNLLDEVTEVLVGQTYKEFQKQSPSDQDKVNYTLFVNKDGKYSWRPLQIIHPALYVSLVNAVTRPENWKVILKQFAIFQANPSIRCLSIPIKSKSKHSNKATQILNWWSGIEQASIELAIDYNYIFHADITDCYGSIYSHSISWALHEKRVAKARNTRRSNQLLGNVIDQHIQGMRYGQTNGIPQGSALMDLIAEIVLGYVDVELTQKLESVSIDYQILRFRDDYRIFVNSPRDGAIILKTLTEVLADLGLRLGPNKTKVSDSVVVSSLKSDKLDWILRKQDEEDLQKHLFIIHNHSVRHPNSGSLLRPLLEFYERTIKEQRIRNPLPLISLVVDIAFHNPRTYPFVASILSKLLASLESRNDAVGKIAAIQEKFKELPNTGHMEIWLQRISYPFRKNLQFAEPLCWLVSGKSSDLWNSSWISNKKLKNSLKAELIIDKDRLRRMSRIVPVREINDFASEESSL